MKLRNGKEYIIQTNTHSINKPIINIYKKARCCICSGLYKKNDYICSCSINNINKHSFHKKCLRTALRLHKQYAFYYGDLSVEKCPYCRSSIVDIQYVKIM